MSKALRAIGAGLGSIAGSLQQHADQQKQDELEARKREKEDREFELRKQSADTAAESARIQNMMNKIKLSTQQVGQVFAASNGSMEATADAINKNMDLGFKLQYDPSKSDDEIKVFTKGTWEKNPDGTFKKDDEGRIKFTPKLDAEGNPVQEPFDQTGFNQFVGKIMNPMNQFAMQAFKEKKEAEAAGTIKTEKETKKVALREAQIRQLDAEAEAEGKPKPTKAQAPVATRRGILGDVKRTAKEADSDKAFMSKISNTYEGVDPDQSFKISEVKSNPQVRKIFQEAASEVIEGKASRAEFIRDAVEMGLHRQFVEDFLTEYEALAEGVAEGKKKPGLVSKAWDLIFN